jgi:PEP-CTERM motif
MTHIPVRPTDSCWVILCAVLAVSLFPATSGATVIFTFAGTTPNTLVDFSFEADLTISGDNLTVVLSNNSLSLAPPSPTLNPNDLLTSFYFEIIDGLNNRPTLTYASASGDVYLGDKTNVDSLVTAGANLKAVIAGDDTWQFRQGLTMQFGSDVLSFGVGTAGNNSLSPNGFMGNIVDGLDYGIYAGDITTNNLDGKLLVKGPATFNFTGVSGFTEADISDEALFGLGTQPDSTAFVPEPGTFLLACMALVGLWLGYHSRRKRSNELHA